MKKECKLIPKEYHSANMMTFSNASLHRGASAVGGWVELGRSVLCSPSCISNITVSGLSAHENLMILAQGSSACGGIKLDMEFNGDTTSNYSERRSCNGATDTTNVNASDWKQHAQSGSLHCISVTYVKNISGQEKLGISHTAGVGCAGECNAPTRKEFTGKWDNLCAQITRVDIDTNTSYSTGDQVVVLGWDKCNTHAPECSFWQPLGQTTVTCATDNIEVASFAGKEWLMVNTYTNPCGNVDRLMTFNNDSCSNYAKRLNSNGASDSTTTNDTFLPNYAWSATQPTFTTHIIRNQSNKEKLGIQHIFASEGAGECSTPNRREIVYKWDNTASQITTIDLTNTDTGSFGAGSFVQVWGAD